MTADLSPDRVSLLHKGGDPIYGAAGADTPSRAEGPSSVTQLPILTALHARFPTLFTEIIHDKWGKVNSFFKKWAEKMGQWTYLPGCSR